MDAIADPVELPPTKDPLQVALLRSLCRSCLAGLQWCPHVSRGCVPRNQAKLWRQTE